MRVLAAPGKQHAGLAGIRSIPEIFGDDLAITHGNHGIGIDPVRKDEVQAAPLLIGWIERLDLGKIDQSRLRPRLPETAGGVIRMLGMNVGA